MGFITRLKKRQNSFSIRKRLGGTEKIKMKPAFLLESAEKYGSLDAELLVSEQTIKQSVKKIASKISDSLKDEQPIFVILMNGGLGLYGLLNQYVNIYYEVNYIHPSRYDASINGSELRWLKKPDNSFSNRTLLLIDDVFDKGVTLREAVKECKKSGATKVFTAVLVEKQVTDREKTIDVDFTALNLPDKFLIGAGMDYQGMFRNLKDIYALKLD